MTKGEQTKKKILEAGLTMWGNISLRAIAKKMKLSGTAVNYHFKAHELPDAVAAYAVQVKHKGVIKQLIATDHPAVSKMAKAERMTYFV